MKKDSVETTFTPAEDGVVSDGSPPSSVANASPKAKRNFLSWFDENDGPLERRLILKLDVAILSFAFLSFWVMYIDRGIIQNAYISGMRESLQLTGNEFAQLNSCYTAGYAITLIPSTLLITKVPAHIVIPTSTLLWGLFTLTTFWATSFSQVAAFRFFVGFFEGPQFCAIHYVLGSWYRPDELVRRAGLYYSALGLGVVSTGLIASGTYTALDGSLGYEGWRWMFLVAACITFPIAIFGYLVFPGALRDSKRWLFTEEEHQLAHERMRLCGRARPQGLPFALSSVKRFLGRWHFWILIPWNVLWLLGYGAMTFGSHVLWIRSNAQYSIAEANRLTTVGPALAVAFTLIFSWTVDTFGDKAKLPLVGFVTTVGFILNFGFIMYDKTSFEWKWAAVATGYMEVSLSPMIYSWANLICAGDAEERAFIISAMLTVCTVMNVWVPLVFWQTVESPKFAKGYIFQTTLQPIYFLWTCLVYYMATRYKKGRTPS